MRENIFKFFKNLSKKDQEDKSKRAAKERLHLVLMQDRANVSADFLELMKQEIIDVIKKYIEVDESEIDVRLTNKTNTDGTTGAPALYANIPIMSLKSEAKKASNEVIKREEEIKKATQQAEKAEKLAKKKADRVRKIDEKLRKVDNKVNKNTNKVKNNNDSIDTTSKDANSRNKTTQSLNGKESQVCKEYKEDKESKVSKQSRESKTAAAKAATKAAFNKMTSKIKSMQK